MTGKELEDYLISSVIGSEELPPEDLEEPEETLEEEASQLREDLAERRLQYEQLQLRSKDYFRKVEREQWEKQMSSVIPPQITQEISDEEIELELLKRKEAIKGGKKQ